MKDIYGNEIPETPMLDIHGRKTDHKGNLISQVVSEVKHDVETAGHAVEHVAEAPFHDFSFENGGFEKHEDAPAAPAEPAKEETPAEAPAASEVKPDSGAEAK